MSNGISIWVSTWACSRWMKTRIRLPGTPCENTITSYTDLHADTLPRFHQLRCIARFRLAIQVASEGRSVGTDFHDDHWPHCLDYMRKVRQQKDSYLAMHRESRLTMLSRWFFVTRMIPSREAPTKLLLALDTALRVRQRPARVDLLTACVMC
jgi:hypothetical protein